MITSESSKTLMQVLAVLAMAAILSMIVHKSYADVSIIAAKHSGWEFWREVAVWMIGNLAGGKSPGS